MLPVADGGDGTVAAAVTAGYAGHRRRRRADRSSRSRRRTRWTAGAPSSSWPAVVGLDLLPGGQLDPLDASTYGLGLVIERCDRARRDRDRARARRQRLDRRRRRDGPGPGRAAARRRRRRAGAAAAVRCPSSPPSTWIRCGRRCGSARDHRGERRRQPAAGPDGAAAVFGPQKGAEDRRLGHAGARPRRLGRGRCRGRPARTSAVPGAGRGRRHRLRGAGRCSAPRSGRASS